MDLSAPMDRVLSADEVISFDTFLTVSFIRFIPWFFREMVDDLLI